jgi:hypothetical protein
MEIKTIDENDENKQERPPIFSSWRWLYAVVLLNLAFLIALFFLFTKAFE